MIRAIALFFALALGACTLDIAPSIPEVSSGGTLVIADPRAKAVLELEGSSQNPDLDCEAVCPTRSHATIDSCHPTRIDPRMARHVAHRGGAEAAWIVCYYEAD